MLTDDDFHTLAEFRFQMRKFERFSELACQSERIRPQQYLLMLQVRGASDRGWATVGELAHRLQITPHAAVALVSRCEAQGYVERRSDPQDKRQVQVHLTLDGNDVLHRLAALHKAELRSLRGQFQVPQLDADA